MAKYDSILFNSGFAVGSTVYDDHYPGDDEQNRIVLNVALEGQKGTAVKMIVDSGAPWCILNPRLLEEGNLVSEVNYSHTTKLNIRGEIRWGHLIRANVILKAMNGENLKVEATFFVPFMESDEVWNYPNFLGLGGFLDRIRYAVDASENAFYFGRF